jgi:hypothetical protein
MQSLCNQSVTRKMLWSVGRVAEVMINAKKSAEARKHLPVGRDAALEITAKLPLGRDRHALPLPIVLTERTASLEMLLHRLIQ